MKYESMFRILKTDDFQMWFLYKSDLRICFAEKHLGIIRIKQLWTYSETLNNEYIERYLVF